MPAVQEEAAVPPLMASELAHRIRRLRERFFTDSPLRVHEWTTGLLGRRHARSQRRIEIDITYGCNLKCYNCDRSCRQAPAEEQVTVEQIHKFVGDSIRNGTKWERIRILGGEPTLHPNLMDILEILLKYRRSSSHETWIQLVTNGFGDGVNEVLSRIPPDIDVENAHKTTQHQVFVPFNVAPLDFRRYRGAEFSNACWITARCGIGLTPYGYYCCAVAGGIDRVFGHDVGKKTLPSPDDSLVDQMRLFCKVCGHFVTRRSRARDEMMSPTWKRAYESYKRRKPDLSLY